MVATPCCCVKVEWEGGELLDKRADGGEGWLADDRLNRDGDHASAHYFYDGGHGGRDGCHYFSLKTINHKY